MTSLQERVQRAVRENVDIAPHDPRWPDLFLREARHLQASLPAGLIRRIEHFGSTAVPGLAAKPIVDMLGQVTSLRAARLVIAPILEAQGYDTIYIQEPVECSATGRDCGRMPQKLQHGSS